MEILNALTHVAAVATPVVVIVQILTFVWSAFRAEVPQFSAWADEPKNGACLVRISIPSGQSWIVKSVSVKRCLVAADDSGYVDGRWSDRVPVRFDPVLDGPLAFQRTSGGQMVLSFWVKPLRSCSILSIKLESLRMWQSKRIEIQAPSAFHTTNEQKQK